MKKYLIAVLFLFPLAFYVNVQAQTGETITLTTYYPAPFGVYRELRLFPTTPSTCSTANDEGKMYYDAGLDEVRVCRQTSVFPPTYTWQAIDNLWRLLGGSFLYAKDPAWNVGIGTTTFSPSKLSVATSAPATAIAGQSGSGVGVFGLSTNNVGVWGQSASNIGVRGQSVSWRGVEGFSSSNIGVAGGSGGSQPAILGSSISGRGVNGLSTNNVGVWGQSASNIGVYGLTTSGVAGVFGAGTGFSSRGVKGWHTIGIGVEGESTSNAGVYGQSSSFPGVWGWSASNVGVYGASGSSQPGVLGFGASGRGVSGQSGSSVGVWGQSTSNIGVYGQSGGSQPGVWGWSAGSVGVYGASGSSQPGVQGVSASSNGVFGQSSSAPGVWGWSSSSIGVYGTGATGVQGDGTGLYNFYAGGTAGTDYGTFTGAHEVKFADNFSSSVLPGMILSLTGETQVRKNEKNQVSLSSTLPTVKLSSEAKDKAVLGVFVGETPLPEEHWYKSREGERFGAVNALGDGRVWVSNINGNISLGDYLTTSSIPGYGQKQDDDLLHNYTLGKATEEVDWEKVEETIEHQGKKYKVYLLAVVYHSG